MDVDVKRAAYRELCEFIDDYSDDPEQKLSLLMAVAGSVISPLDPKVRDDIHETAVAFLGDFACTLVIAVNEQAKRTEALMEKFAGLRKSQPKKRN